MALRERTAPITFPSRNGRTVVRANRRVEMTSIPWQVNDALSSQPDMCGFVAIVDPVRSSDEVLAIGQSMLAITAHRGPDHSGTWTTGPVMLGHNRLSIIDLSSASHQPMTMQDCTITYNGEVYNYLELREQLEHDGFTFSTSGDTEVILAAYLRWGERCVEHFIGMWAFAIWDGRSRTLFCSRDRFGIKPFHYAQRDGSLYAASEIKAIQQCPLYRGGLNEAQIARGLYMGWMHHHEETYFQDIKALPASHNLRWHDNQITVWHYAGIDTVPASATFDDSVSTFRSLFLDSVRLTARRDVPMGVCLSGGLDSTSIACALASSTDELEVRTFTAYYDGPGQVDERPYIDHVLRAYPQIKPAYISPTDADVAASIDRIVHMMDAPMPSSSYVSQYFVMQLAASHGVKVVLDGQGSDEILGGYMHSAYRVFTDAIRDRGLVDAVRDQLAHVQRQHFSASKSVNVFAKSMLAALRDEPSMTSLELRNAFPWVLAMAPSDVGMRIDMPRGSRLNAFLSNLIHVTLLPTLLHTEDLNSMAFSIESRVPFLDHRLVQACFHMPTDHKVYRGETKRVLRAAMRGIVPDAVLDRADKTGFTTPGHITWLRGSLSYLLDGSWSDLDGLVNRPALAAVLERYRKGDNTHALFVWRLAMLRAFLSARR